MFRTAVIGAGIAGTSAAWALLRGSTEVVVFDHRSGASSLYSGILDGESISMHPSFDADLLHFAADLAVWSLNSDSCRVATSSGVLREARGLDTALLDIAPLVGKRIGVLELPREDWDAVLLAKALGASKWARATGTEFVPLKVPLLRSSVERRIPAFDFAALFDERERSAELILRLHEAAGRCDAWLLGPWLGTDPDVCERVRNEVGIPLGETSSAPGGAAGARFELGRERLFASRGIEMRRAEVVRLEARFSGWTVHFKTGEVGVQALVAETFEADAVVLATGGLAGGGVRLTTPLVGERLQSGFELSVEVPLDFQLDGRILDRASSLHGIDFQARGSSALERLGVAADGVRALGQPGVYVAGDIVADRPRTALEAARAGIAAGNAILSMSPRLGARGSAPP